LLRSSEFLLNRDGLKALSKIHQTVFCSAQS